LRHALERTHAMIATRTPAAQGGKPIAPQF
jgi:hypothetical protein